MRTKLPPKTPEYLAALRAVQAHKDDPRIRRALHAAVRSRDPEIVRAAMTRETVETDAADVSP